MNDTIYLSLDRRVTKHRGSTALINNGSGVKGGFSQQCLNRRKILVNRNQALLPLFLDDEFSIFPRSRIVVPACYCSLAALIYYINIFRAFRFPNFLESASQTKMMNISAPKPSHIGIYKLKKQPFSFVIVVCRTITLAYKENGARLEGYMTRLVKLLVK